MSESTRLPLASSAGRSPEYVTLAGIAIAVGVVEGVSVGAGVGGEVGVGVGGGSVAVAVAVEAGGAVVSSPFMTQSTSRTMSAPRLMARIRSEKEKAHLASGTRLPGGASPLPASELRISP